MLDMSIFKLHAILKIIGYAVRRGVGEGIQR